MQKASATVIVIGLALMALLWLYEQPDPVPKFPEPGPETAASKSNGANSAVTARSTPQTAAPPAVSSATTGAARIGTSARPAAPDPDAEMSALGAEQTDETAIPITPGFERLLEPAPRARARAPSAALERHDSLLEEPRDEKWAQRIESAIRSFIESRSVTQGSYGQRIEMPVIECRTTLCEIQGVGVTADAHSPRSLPELVKQLIEGPLASEFADSSTDVVDLPDGRLGYLVFLMRNRSP